MAKNFASLSIIITVHNLEDCLEDALASLENQSIPPDEVIIINDGSKDNSEKIIQKFLSRNKWKSFYIPNSGPGIARNYGLSFVSSEYVLFLDGDDVFSPSLIKDLRNATLERTDIVVFGSHELDDRSRQTLPLTWSVRKKYISNHKSSFSPVTVSGYLLLAFMGWPWDKMFKIDFIKQYDFQFPNLYNSEDLTFVYSALAYASNIKVLDTSLIHHRINRRSSVSNSLGDNPFDFERAILLLINKLKENPIIWEREKKGFPEWALDYYVWRIANTKNVAIQERLRETLREDGIWRSIREDYKKNKKNYVFLSYILFFYLRKKIPCSLVKPLFYVYWLEKFGLKIFFILRCRIFLVKDKPFKAYS